MEIIEAIRNRHSVRQYIDKSIEPEEIERLNALITRLNEEGKLNIQLVTDEPKAFDCMMARYGKFTGVKNYLAMVGKKSYDLDRRVGYYGEWLVLEAQRMGLNTCWVGMSYKKVPEAFRIEDDEKLVCVIALGYGATQGSAHKIKSVEKVARVNGEMPEWFRRGVGAALLAPTAVNQQKFRFELTDGNVVDARAGLGFYSKVDLGIACYHFEVAAGKNNFRWKSERII